MVLTTKIGELKQEDLNTNLSGIYEYEIGSYEANHNTVTKFQDKRIYINSNYMETKISSVTNEFNGIKNDINDRKKESTPSMKISELKKVHQTNEQE